MTCHLFQVNYFRTPILCSHCHDYIWGTSSIGYKCVKCGLYVHSECKLFVCKDECEKASSDGAELLLSVNEEPFAIDCWSKIEVREWLAVVNLHRYSELFYKSSINGPKLLSLNVEKLFEMRIRDTFHHEAIMNARNELLYRSQITNEQMKQREIEVETHLRSNQYKPDRHYFLIATLSSTTECKICHHKLLGIIFQGLVCQQCGIVVHRQCSCLGLPDCVSPVQRAKIVQYHLFGVSLFDLMSENAEAPLILIKSFTEIETRSLETNEDLFDIYRLSSDTVKIERFKQQLNENGVELTQFVNYDLNTIAAVVKAFLRELQDSVIPEEEYETFCNCECLSKKEFGNMVNGLHPLHLQCLKYIMRHLIRVWNYQHENRDANYLPDKLFHIFRTILLRPPWSRIIEITKNLDKQVMVMKRLFVDYDWGLAIPKFKHRPEVPPSPLTPTVADSECKKRFSDAKPQSVVEMPWYWNDVGRDDTLMILKDSKDGTFLVRNSSDKSTDSQSPYTLCFIKASNVKSVKIFYDAESEYYDIERPCRFESIQSLIDYYKANSLKEYNPTLDVRLEYPLSKYEFGKTTDWNLDRLYSSFREAYQQYENSIRKCDGIEVELATLNEDLNNKRLACQAFQNIIELFNEQLHTLKDNLITVQHQRSQINANIETIKRKIGELSKNREELIVDCDYLNIIIQQLSDELEQLRPDMIEMRKKRENYHMWLIQRGESDDQIMKILKTPKIPALSSTISASSSSLDTSDMYVGKFTEKPIDLHENSVNWFSVTIDRAKADELLSNGENGTYLVRPGSKAKYVLSVIYNNDIKHCLIDEDADGCFIKTSDGTKTRKFSSLTNLIVYYSKNTLKNYNSALDTCLMYPALFFKRI